MSTRTRAKGAEGPAETPSDGPPSSDAAAPVADASAPARPLAAVFMLLANPDYARSVADRANALKLPSRHHRAVGDGVDEKDGPDELLGPETADGMARKARPARRA